MNDTNIRTGSRARALRTPAPGRRRAVMLVLTAALLLLARSAPAAPEHPASATRLRPAAPWFTNVAGACALKDVLASRTQWADLNGDGWPDAVLTHTAAPKPDAVSIYLSTAGPDGTRRFVDVTRASNLRDNRWLDDKAGRVANVLLAGDVDNDGDLDLFTGAYADLLNPKAKDHGNRSRILLNDGSGRFQIVWQPDTPAARPPSALPATTCAACFVDVDRDGRLDLFVGNWYRTYGASYDAYNDRLFRGAGDGRFADMTKAAGLWREPSPLHALSEAERAGDLLKLPAARQALVGRGAARPTYGVAHADYDNDGDQDLFVMAYGRQANLLWRNDGTPKDAPEGAMTPRFTEVGAAAHFDGDAKRSGVYPEWTKKFWKQRFGKEREDELTFRAHGNTFDLAFGDLDNDGDLDWLTGEITHSWAGDSSDRSMFGINQCLTDGARTDGPVTFLRQPDALPRARTGTRWNQGDMSVALFDADNDGWLDALVASSDYPDDQRLRLFHQNPTTHAFTDVTGEVGLDWPMATQLSLADFDRDGDLDILVGNTHNRLPKDRRASLPLGTAVWRNEIGNTRSWVAIVLQGAARPGKPGGANRGAVGARLTIRAGGRTQMREITGGHGHSGHQDDRVVLVGLGDAKTIERLTVRWPDRGGPGGQGSLQTFADVAPGRYYRLSQGGSLEPDEPRAYRAPSPTAGF